MSIYDSEFCTVDTYTPDGLGTTPRWFIGDAHDSYNTAEWPTRQAMIADLEAALDALRALA